MKRVMGSRWVVSKLPVWLENPKVSGTAEIARATAVSNCAGVMLVVRVSSSRRTWGDGIASMGWWMIRSFPARFASAERLWVWGAKGKIAIVTGAGRLIALSPLCLL